ncbi:MAG: folate-binding protein [Stappiaceae bacterium]
MGLIAELTDRGIVRIAGPERSPFLQNLLTCNMDLVENSGPQFGALLTPQGKILFDFLIANSEQGYLVDLPLSLIPTFIKRLGFYKLRAKVDIEDVSQDLAALAIWDCQEEPEIPALTYRDPRLSQLGFRAIGARSGLGADFATQGLTHVPLHDYHTHRIRLCVPQGELDYDYGSIFPHDVNMDGLNGIDFSKGCYVGQEVVSRVKHRGTARKRMISVVADGSLPVSGTPITASGKSIGTLCSSAGSTAIAQLRLDRVKNALDQNVPLFVEDTEVHVSLPGWANFDWPETEAQTGKE